jgi:hypothetical protein
MVYCSECDDSLENQKKFQLIGNKEIYCESCMGKIAIAIFEDLGIEEKIEIVGVKEL